MAATLQKVVKIFIGSPGGLESERQAAKRIIDDVNQSHSEYWGCQLKLVGWEETLSGYRRAQSLINEDLDACDYFVGAIWNHWGSKPEDGDTVYTSGFQEEFERACARVECAKMKDVALFFKEIPEAQRIDPGPSVAKVLSFRNECVRKRKPLFKEFSEVSDFERLFRRTIEKIGWLESGLHENRLNDASSQQLTEVSKVDAIPLIGSAPAKFVTTLLNRSSTDITALDVARLRLVALSTHRQGNDDVSLGVHDANLLYSSKDKFDFDQWEISALIRSGVTHFHYQSAPLWHWLAKNKGELFVDVIFLAAFSDSQQRQNAIRILDAAGQKIPSVEYFYTSDQVLALWLGEGADEQVFQVALEFLISSNAEEHIATLERLMNDQPANRKDRLAEAIIWILAKTDLSKAFNQLIEWDPDPVRDEVASLLFANPTSVPSDTALRCLSLRADGIRRAAAQLLSVRDAIDEPTAERLITDADLDIRIIGLESFLQFGRSVEDESLKRILFRPKSSGFGVFGGFASSAQMDESFYLKFKQRALLRLSYEELRKRTDAADVLDYRELLALYRAFPKTTWEEMKANASDGFKNYFERKILGLANAFGGDNVIVANVRGLEDFLRNRLLSGTLNIICENADGSEIALVRKLIDESKADYSSLVLNYLRKYGNWSDKDRILEFAARGSQLSLASILFDDRSKHIGAALYSISKGRIADLLNSKIDISTHRAAIASMSKRDINELTEDLRIRLLSSNDGLTRKIFALKCVISLSRPRVISLLKRYLALDGLRYYNSIFWLDLAASLPTSIAKVVAKNELKKFAS